MEYKEFPKIDFFVLDEFYKLSAERDEERSDVLNNAFNYLVNTQNSRFYLLGPNIDGISDGFAEKYNAEFLKTNYSLVDNRTINLWSDEFGRSGAKKTAKENALFEMLWRLRNEQSIIYCSSPRRARYRAKQFCNYLDKRIEVTGPELSLVGWIRANVSPRWELIDCLNHRIGVHDGAL